jgi:hypothetical protein
MAFNFLSYNVSPHKFFWFDVFFLVVQGKKKKKQDQHKKWLK